MIFNGLSGVGDDPILVVTKMYHACADPNKVDLGVGVYKDENGDTVILDSVKKAEQYLVNSQKTKTYLSPAGNPEYNDCVQKLLLGDDHPAITQGRVTTIQAPGGTGGIRVGADFLKICKPDAKVWISDPTWPNHYGIMSSSGLQTEAYRYYDIKKGEFLYSEMMEDLNAAQPGDVIILHGCCHNASGADLTREQWDELTNFMDERGLVPFLDIAYQGFAEGILEDAYAIRLMSEKLPEVLIASSCSKNFAMYRDRVGAITLVSSTSELNKINASHMSKVARSIYSMPPDHGAAVVAHILSDDALRKQWMREVDGMRSRIKEMRNLFAKKMTEKAPNSGFGYIAEQNGMFSFLTLSADQIQTLIKDYNIYFMANGRVNIAGLTEDNIDYVTDSIAVLFNS